MTAAVIESKALLPAEARVAVSETGLVVQVPTKIGDVFDAADAIADATE